MADQLPIISGVSAVDTTALVKTSLIGRGLSAIQRKKTGIVLSDLDIRYRKARDIYNRITDYGYYSLDLNFDLITKRAELYDDNQLLKLRPLFEKLQQLKNLFTEFQLLADQGYGKAYYPLSSMYEGGQGISKNTEKEEFYRELASDWLYDNRGLEDPEIWTDFEYIRFIYVYEDDDKKELFWCRKAANQGHIPAQILLGQLYQCGEEVEENAELSIFWYRKAAEQGDAFGQYKLAYTLHDENIKQAVFWYRKAAEQGNCSAHCALGEMYNHNDDIWLYTEDRGTEHDCKQAIFWYERAAEQGDFIAQSKLGNIHNNGCQCGEHSSEKALFWYFISETYDNIGWMYENGRGVEKDTEQAISWYLKSVRNNILNGFAKEKLAKLGINWMDE